MAASHDVMHDSRMQTAEILRLQLSGWNPDGNWRREAQVRFYTQAVSGIAVQDFPSEKEALADLKKAGGYRIAATSYKEQAPVIAFSDVEMTHHIQTARRLLFSPNLPIIAAAVLG